VVYDAKADVLYIAKEQGPATRGVEDKYGLVWRYNSSGDLIGLTVVDFADYWSENQPLLANEMAKRFHIPEPQARVVLEHALDEDH
jgi:uncharacterized protein YuzE